MLLGTGAWALWLAGGAARKGPRGEVGEVRRGWKERGRRHRVVRCGLSHTLSHIRAICQQSIDAPGPGTQTEMLRPIGWGTKWVAFSMCGSPFLLMMRAGLRGRRARPGAPAFLWGAVVYERGVGSFSGMGADFEEPGFPGGGRPPVLQMPPPAESARFRSPLFTDLAIRASAEAMIRRLLLPCPGAQPFRAWRGGSAGPWRPSWE